MLYKSLIYHYDPTASHLVTRSDLPEANVLLVGDHGKMFMKSASEYIGHEEKETGDGDHDDTHQTHHLQLLALRADGVH